MDFLSGIFIAITAFFGFGQSSNEVVEKAVVVEVVEESVSLSEESQSEEVVATESVVIFDEEVNQTKEDIVLGEVVENEMLETPWQEYKKPSKEVLKSQLDTLTYKVTQEDGTEKSGTSPLDKNWEEGIYVDVLSGEPLYSSKDKYDSGTGWPSFTKPIVSGVLTLHEDNKLFSKRTETRSAIADNHIGHVFTDGPKDKGGLRYCMNGVALKFVPKADMEAKGYGEFIQYI